MGSSFLLALGALRQLRPFLTASLYEGLLAAVALRDNSLGVRTLLSNLAESLGRMPRPGELTGEPKLALRFVFMVGSEKVTYLVERPVSGDKHLLLTFIDQLDEQAPFQFTKASLAEMLAAGAILDVTFDPASFAEMSKRIVAV